VQFTLRWNSPPLLRVPGLGFRCLKPYTGKIMTQFSEKRQIRVDSVSQLRDYGGYIRACKINQDYRGQRGLRKETGSTAGFGRTLVEFRLTLELLWRDHLPSYRDHSICSLRLTRFSDASHHQIHTKHPNMLVIALAPKPHLRRIIGPSIPCVITWP
jgi:hypothetical protein